MGSVFSPYYAWARRRRGEGGAAATEHCSINVALYHRPPGARRFRTAWAMTERGERQLQRDALSLQIGPSALRWIDGTLDITLNERTMPWGGRVAGRVRLEPEAAPGRVFALDPAGRHRWQPVHPRATVVVDLQHPARRWQCTAYFDANVGERPLEQDFQAWDWSRQPLPGGGVALHYDVQSRDGSAHALALRMDAAGRLAAAADAPIPWALPRTRWGLGRTARCTEQPVLVDTLEDGPFYSRSLWLPSDAAREGPGHWAMHESLSLDRFASPWVQALLPFRMPRRAG